jgi:hypothetical protein
MSRGERSQETGFDNIDQAAMEKMHDARGSTDPVPGTHSLVSLAEADWISTDDTPTPIKAHVITETTGGGIVIRHFADADDAEQTYQKLVDGES